MKTLGLIGGMSWESTVTYYQVINRTIKAELGGLHSARCILHSVDFGPIEEMLRAGNMDGIAAALGAAAQGLERAGAEFFIICTNTMHMVADKVAAQVSIPFLHIADLTASAIRQAGLERVGLLGTRGTMEGDFISSRLESAGLSVTTPDQADRIELHRVIFDELCRGEFKPESKSFLLGVMDKLQSAGAQGMVLGCTELGLLVTPADTSIPLFDTALIHAEQAALHMLA